MNAPEDGDKFVLVDEENDLVAYGLYETREAATYAAVSGVLSDNDQGEPWGDPNTYRGHPHPTFVSWRVQTLKEFEAREDHEDCTYVLV